MPANSLATAQAPLRTLAVLAGDRLTIFAGAKETQ